MLSPDAGVTLLRALEPPGGHALDVAIGTSFTLDLTALLAVPTAFALTRGTDSASSEQTPLTLLEALREHVGKITVFSDASHISLPEASGASVLSFLEGSVVPVRAPRGGLFHPKLWILRFVDDAGGYVHRVLLASRNLTFDRSWDTMVCLEEGQQGSPLPELAEIIRDLLKLETHTPPSAARQRDLRNLAISVASARMEAPAGFYSMRLHPLGFRKSGGHRLDGVPTPLPASSLQTLVVSPFLSSALLPAIDSATVQLTLIARADELDRAYANVAESNRPNAFVLDPRLTDDSGDQVLTDLHAKAFIHDVAGKRTHVFTGSANATSQAFTGNTEVLLEMIGRTQDVGVGRFLDDSASSLKKILVQHHWAEPQEEDSENADSLRSLQRSLGPLAVTATVIQRDDELYTVCYRSETPLPNLAGAELHARPVTIKEWTRQDGGHLELTTTTTLPQMTGFLGLRINLADEQADLVIACQLIDAPENREDQLLAHLIADSPRLVRYLLMLLTNLPEDRFDGTLMRMLGAAAQSGAKLTTLPLMELMLRALVNSPERLLSVRRLMDVVRLRPDLADPSLLELWDAIAALVPAQPRGPHAR